MTRRLCHSLLATAAILLFIGAVFVSIAVPQASAAWWSLLGDLSPDEPTIDSQTAIRILTGRDKSAHPRDAVNSLLWAKPTQVKELLLSVEKDPTGVDVQFVRRAVRSSPGFPKLWVNQMNSHSPGRERARLLQLVWFEDGAEVREQVVRSSFSTDAGERHAAAATLEATWKLDDTSHRWFVDWQRREKNPEVLRTLKQKSRGFGSARK